MYLTFAFLCVFYVYFMCAAIGVIINEWISQKARHQNCVHIFARSWPIKKNFTGRLGRKFTRKWLLSIWVFWHIVVSMVLVRITSPATLPEYPTFVQDKDYARRLLQLLLFLLHYPPHFATDRAFPVIAASLWNSLPDDITTAVQHLLWLFDTNWKHFYFVNHMPMSWLLDNLFLFYRLYLFLDFYFIFLALVF